VNKIKFSGKKLINFQKKKKRKKRDIFGQNELAGAELKKKKKRFFGPKNGKKIEFKGQKLTHN